MKAKERRAAQAPAPKRNERPSAVLVFGESEHDRQAIRHLVHGLRPDLVGHVEERRRPLVLIKGASPPKARSNAEEIAALIQQERRARKIRAVLAHEDCDAIEPAHVVAENRIENELKAAGCPVPAYAVTPAWEIEAWWMVFPEAVGRVVAGWRDPDDWLGRDVGRVADAKEQLAKAVQPRPRVPKPPRAYHERDSIEVAANITRGDLLSSFSGGVRTTRTAGGAMTQTRSASFERFRIKILSIPTE